MTVPKEIWAHPENGTPEQLLEMVVMQRAWIKAAKKKAAKANSKLEHLEQRWWHSYLLVGSVNDFIRWHEKEHGEVTGWLKRAKLNAAAAAKRLHEAINYK